MREGKHDASDGWLDAEDGLRRLTRARGIADRRKSRAARKNCPVTRQQNPRNLIKSVIY